MLTLCKAARDTNGPRSKSCYKPADRRTDVIDEVGATKYINIFLKAIQDCRTPYGEEKDIDFWLYMAIRGLASFLRRSGNGYVIGYIETSVRYQLFLDLSRLSGYGRKKTRYKMHGNETVRK